MKKAFTLAEVLITLGIIGVVAALTLPSLIQKQNEKATVSRLKKFYSTIQQAFILAQNENGSINNWEYSNSAEFFNYFRPYLKIQKYCGGNGNCWPDTNYKFLHGSDWVNINNIPNYEKAILSDGSLLQVYAKLDKTDREIRIDTNGFKGPNTEGIDMFSFKFNDKGVIPNGFPDTSFEGRQFKDYCNLNATVDYNGTACTAWVIMKENMDYLHCNDLDWDVKTKCK